MPTCVLNEEGLKFCLQLENLKIFGAIFRGASLKRETVDSYGSSSIYNPKKHHPSIDTGMCAETLGCENGAEYSSSLSSNKDCLGSKEKIKHIQSVEKRESMIGTNPMKFLPRFSKLHGENRLRLARIREDGRLVLLAYKPCLIEAERTHGHLVVHFLGGISNGALQATSMSKKTRV